MVFLLVLPGASSGVQHDRNVRAAGGGPVEQGDPAWSRRDILSVMFFGYKKFLFKTAFNQKSIKITGQSDERKLL